MWHSGALAGRFTFYVVYVLIFVGGIYLVVDIKQIVKGAKLKITNDCLIAWAPGGKVEGIMYRKNMVLICGADKYGDSAKIEVRKIENGLYGRLYFAKKERLAESAELVK